ncbi:hypothetical protein ATK36_1449 [Amycolatopsis sulphurea]|uniref:Phospholipase D-like protein n=1 Tax=Amycolatopsis sulphurea TaxID=76022 RepID=A0A2A9F7J8_9PSEU|nr:hypothetical protein [Amycolatopsis sulphurea]PFG46470.1 hypothetical protein ATK36_1449 [Amycolatopsis sulphurea]
MTLAALNSSTSAESALAFGLSAGLVTLLAAVLILPAGMFIGALVSVLGGGLKLLLILVIFFAPFLGPLGWFLCGRGSAYQGAR